MSCSVRSLAVGQKLMPVCVGGGGRWSGGATLPTPDLEIGQEIEGSKGSNSQGPVTLVTHVLFFPTFSSSMWRPPWRRRAQLRPYGGRGPEDTFLHVDSVCDPLPCPRSFVPVSLSSETIPTSSWMLWLPPSPCPMRENGRFGEVTFSPV